MKLRQAGLTALLALLVWPGPKAALACDLCAVYNSIESQVGANRSIGTGVAHQFTHYESNVRSLAAPKLPGQHLESNITQAFLSYKANDKFSFQLNLPLIYRDYRRAENGKVEKGFENGLGDITLLANYIPYRWHKEHSCFYWQVTGGAKFPTGDSDRLKEETQESTEELTPHHLRHGSLSGNLIGGDDLALGSGSYDFLFGSGVFYQAERYYLSANLQYSLRQEGDFNYQFGNDLHWDFGPAYFAILEDARSLAFRIKASGEYKSEDEIKSVKVAGSDDHTIFLGPEVRYSHGDSSYFGLSLGLPVKNESASDRVVQVYKLMATFSHNWH